MGLGDVGRLSTLDRRVLDALRARFEALDLIAANGFFDEGPSDIDPVFRPIRDFHLRRPDPATVALRMWSYRDPVSEDDARRMLGDVPLAPLLDAGLLVRAGAGIVSPFTLSFSEGVFVIGDELADGGDSVMGLGLFTIEMMRAVWGEGDQFASALDLGCGAGAAALFLASSAQRVVGSDINPRAAVVGALNARLNGLDNVEFRVGDLFEPMKGERFDVVVSQPPFLPRPDAAPEAIYMFGGSRGDELPLRALADLPGFLSPRGRAVMVIQWGVFDDEPIEARIRRVMPDPTLDLLVLEAPSRNRDAASVGDAMTEFPELGPDYERSVKERREHYDRIGCRDLVDTIVVVDRAVGRPAFTGKTRVEQLEKGRCGREHVDALLSAHALAASGDEALLAAHVLCPKGAAFVPEREGYSMVFPRHALHERIPVDAGARDVLALFASPRDVKSAVRLLSQRERASMGATSERVLRFVRAALRSGLLEGADRG